MLLLLIGCSQVKVPDEPAPNEAALAISRLDSNLMAIAGLDPSIPINRIDNKGLKQGFWVEYRKDSLHDCSVLRNAKRQSEADTAKASGEFEFDFKSSPKPPCGADHVYLRPGGASPGDFLHVEDSIVYEIKVRQFGNYRDNQKQESWTFRGGCYLQKVHFVDNVPNGPFQQFYPDGTIMIEGDSDPAKEKQEYKKYSKNGEFESIVTNIPICFPVSY